ncbi:dihydroneopterin aldolase family protein [Halorubrum sp. F4]|uniref:dihydroneopterin aldolase family protein n=1 Tax=Halorubrum sp. F4 TaxID=2989715 RepID=UPI00247FB8A6|nr:dihydroneopterin aldolase family protein [Halorubrum sp. F4]
MATDAQQACFEAGIKFGSLYHQFAGTPVSRESARSLEVAMAEAIENQPFCASVNVEIHDDRVEKAIDHANDYTELTGSLMDVEMRIDHEGVVVDTRMEMVDGYPLMKLVSVAEGDADHDG